MKKIITIFLVLHSLFSFAQCQLNLLAGDLSKSNKEFKEIVNEALLNMVHTVQIYV